mmetsp:Transcript_11530/g.39955  ORF Transcript_11530/g.39955 Transcript_11530/m.39955 type:complete len:226 (-) Transcript_11530:463-1140(-)
MPRKPASGRSGAVGGFMPRLQARRRGGARARRGVLDARRFRFAPSRRGVRRRSKERRLARGPRRLFNRLLQETAAASGAAEDATRKFAAACRPGQTPRKSPLLRRRPKSAAGKGAERDFGGVRRSADQGGPRRSRAFLRDGAAAPFKEEDGPLRHGRWRAARDSIRRFDGRIELGDVLRRFGETRRRCFKIRCFKSRLPRPRNRACIGAAARPGRAAQGRFGPRL